MPVKNERTSETWSLALDSLMLECFFQKPWIYFWQLIFLFLFIISLINHCHLLQYVTPPGRGIHFTRRNYPLKSFWVSNSSGRQCAVLPGKRLPSLSSFRSQSSCRRFIWLVVVSRRVETNLSCPNALYYFIRSSN